jgi:hypothetical protein
MKSLNFMIHKIQLKPKEKLRSKGFLNYVEESSLRSFYTFKFLFFKNIFFLSLNLRKKVKILILIPY